MSDMKFILPGPEAVTIAGQTIDKLIRAGDGDAALLYLYILKTRGQSSSAEAAAALGKSSGGIATAMAVLSRLGLVRLDENTDSTEKNSNDDMTAKPPIGEPRQYSVAEIEGELQTGTEFHSLVQEAQNSLGKIMSPDELLRLFGIYDALRIPPEVILQLITHCISESHGRGGGRMPSMRYIEKAAYSWEREGIFSLDRAEEYLKTLEARKSARGKIKAVLQIRDRELSESEKRYVDGWIAMGFDPEAIEIAYDRTVVQTGKLAWNYIDKIMKSWHSKNLHSPQEISEKDRWQSKDDSMGVPKPSAQKFGAPDQEEIKRMERLLSKIRDT